MTPGGFLLLTLTILIIPGPDVLFVMARALGQGTRAGLLSVVGIGAGVLVHTALAAFGLSRLFLHVPAAYEIVRYAGIAYLIYLAIRILRERRSFQADDASPARDPPARLVRQAFLTNLLNPKAALFFVAILPQMVPGGAPADALFLQLLLWGLVVVALSMAVNAAYALLAARAASWFRANARADRIQRWASAGMLGAIAILAARAAAPGDA